MSDRDKSEFWTLFGWCLAWIGFGACCLMTRQQGPVVTIQVGGKPEVRATNGVERVDLPRVGEGVDSAEKK